MKAKSKNLVLMLLLAGLLLTGLVVLNGCKKSEPAAPPPEEAASATIEQTTCPIMDKPINKALFTEYKGKKVYYCCPSCKEKFEKEPEKYLAKLPQFKD